MFHNLLPSRGRCAVFGCVSLFFFLACSLCGCSDYKVFSVKENPKLKVAGGTLYALPKTEIRVDITIERRDVSHAPFYSYATDFLGIDESNLDTSFRIVSLSVEPVQTPDPNHFYYVRVHRGSVAVDENHLLLAIGLPVADELTSGTPMPYKSAMESSVDIVKAENNLYDRQDTFYSRYDSPGRPTMVLSKKDVRNVRRRAMDAADRLEEIQRKQQQLISGEYEGNYSVESVQYLAAQLRSQEENIVSQFCGIVRRETISLYIDPVFSRTGGWTDTIALISPSEGLVDVASAVVIPVDAAPVVCTVNSLSTLRRSNRFVKFHTSGATMAAGDGGNSGKSARKNRDRHTFRYRLPEQAIVQLSVEGESLSVSRIVSICQLGVLMELPRHRVKALFDPNTFDLKYFSR